MTNFAVVKLAARVVAILSVSKVTTDIIKNNVTATNSVEAFQIFTGSLILSTMMVDYSLRYLEKTLTAIKENWENEKDRPQTSS